jgi:aerotaxis receptor
MAEQKNIGTAPHASREYEIGANEFLVLVSDKAGNFVYANPAYCRASGFAWDELKGTIMSRMMDKDTPVQVSMDMTYTIKGKRPWTGIIKNKRKNGDYYWLRLNLSPIFTANNAYAGGLLVHSKATREEIAHYEPLYRQMTSGQGKDLLLRHGKVYRLNLLGKAQLFLHGLGLRGKVWGAALSAACVGIACVLGVAHKLDAQVWMSIAVMLAACGAIGKFLGNAIVAPIRQSIRVANDIAAGNLSTQLESSRTDEVGELMRALNQMNMNMRATVVDVRDGVGVMQRATHDIASGTMDLSERTNNQAAHLETTAASMEQMTASVKQTADASKQASTCVTSARATAESGGKVIAEVIATMVGISQSSKKIAEIIGVIDSIAFQTNMLALNAAVEAARAGEQGRGFAVVAAEVRNLAQRSATSAREIRQLIFESVDKINNGTKLVDTAGKTMSDVVAQVRQVTDLVMRIADTSLEQSAGIGQINDGVTNLDNVTQQNAAMVDESTASAESLRLQAEQLAAAVSVFKLTQQENQALYLSTKLTAEETRQQSTYTRAA